MYRKVIENGYITAVGTGIDGDNISKAKYDEIIGIIHSAPKAPEGYQYTLRASDLEWELSEIPPEPQNDATEEDYQDALEQIGVKIDENQ